MIGRLSSKRDSRNWERYLAKRKLWSENYISVNNFHNFQSKKPLNLGKASWKAYFHVIVDTKHMVVFLISHTLSCVPNIAFHLLVHMRKQFVWYFLSETQLSTVQLEFWELMMMLPPLRKIGQHYILSIQLPTENSDLKIAFTRTTGRSVNL